MSTPALAARGAAGGAVRERGRALVVPAVVTYLAAIATAEVLVAFALPLAGAIVDATLIFVIVNHYLLLTMRAGASAADQRAAAMIAVLALVPLLRLVSIAIPLMELREIYRPIAVAVPLLAAVVLVARVLSLRPADLGLRVGSWRIQAAIACGGIPLGLVAFAILRPPVPGASVTQLALEVGILVTFAVLAEELVFRGLVQRVFDGFLGCPGVIWSACLFALVYLGSHVAEYVAFVAGAGVLLGWCVHRSGSIVGVIAAHGLLVAGLVAVWPQVLPPAVVEAPAAAVAVTPPTPLPEARIDGRPAEPRLGLPKALQPAPVVALEAIATRRGARISSLALQAPAGALVQVGCVGRSCPPDMLVLRPVSFDALRLLPFEAWHPAGSRIEIAVTQPGRTGRITKVLVRANAQPLTIEAALTGAR